MNFSAKFQLCPLYSFRGDGLSVAMATNQIQRSGHMFGRELFKKHFCKTFVKISAVREQ